MTWQTVLKEAQKEFGTTKVFRASEAPEVEIVSTGSISLDFALGVGGVPRGTIVEIFGRESIGKTALVYMMMAEEQKRGRFPAFINLEGQIDQNELKWMRALGLNVDDMAVTQADPGTESIQLLAKIVNSGAFGLAAFDSVGAMLSDKEQDAKNKKQSHGQSQLVTHMTKLISQPAARNLCTVVFLNQIRDKEAGMFVTEEAPGGHAIKHQASVRIWLKPGIGQAGRKKGRVHGEEVDIAHQVVAYVKKNKVGAPRQTATYWFYSYPSPHDGTVGIDRTQEVIDLVQRVGIVRREGQTFYHDTFPEGKIVYAAKVESFLRSHPETVEQLREELMDYAYKEERKAGPEMLMDEIDPEAIVDD